MISVVDWDPNEFQDLFEGNPVAYGADHGECIRGYVDRSVWDGHLFGDKPIGIYPLRCREIVHLGAHPGNSLEQVRARTTEYHWEVKWGCADFDEGYEASWHKAERLADSLRAANLTPWIERSRSKGYHVWLFAEDWVPASHMRRTLLAAFQVAGLKPKEVNPKAEQGQDPSFLGNYVRLAYPHMWAATMRQCMVEPGGALGDTRAIDLEPFLEAALETRAPRDTLERLAGLYRPPVRRSVDIGAWDGEVLDGILNRRSLGRVRWRLDHGPWEGQDRSSYLFGLAVCCAEDGATPEEALAIVTHADETVTHKYVDRNDAADRYYSLVENAYS